MDSKELREQVFQILTKYKKSLDKKDGIDFRDFATEEIYLLFNQWLEEEGVEHQVYTSGGYEYPTRYEPLRLEE